MSDNKNHHYVPQSYFRRFSQDGKSICVLTRKAGHLIKSASIGDQASKAWYYGNKTIEQELGKIEGQCCTALNTLTEKRNPTLLDWTDANLILIWVTLQRSRTESARQGAREANNTLFRLQGEVLINNNPEFSDAEKARLIGELPLLELDPVKPQLESMTIAMQQSAALNDLFPLMLVNKTNRPFIFSDAPVIYYNGLCRDVTLRGVLGLSSAGLMVIHPISPNLCLLLVDAKSYKIGRVIANQIAVNSLDDVAALNKLQIHSGSKCIYFNDFKFGPYVQALWSQEKSALTENLGMVVQAPGRAHGTGEPMGDILHSFQPQLPYRLALSFLKHEVLGDADYRQMRRYQR